MSHIILTAEQAAKLRKALKAADAALCEVSPCAWKDCYQGQVDHVDYAKPLATEALAILDGATKVGVVDEVHEYGRSMRLPLQKAEGLDLTRTMPWRDCAPLRKEETK